MVYLTIVLIGFCLSRTLL